MNNKDNKNNNNKNSIKVLREEENNICEVGEDTTQYGEFISSYFGWISLPNQKERVRKMENMTENQKKDKNKEK